MAEMRAAPLLRDTPLEDPHAPKDRRRASPAGHGRQRRIALALCIAGLILALIGALLSGRDALRLFLPAYVFWSGLSVGSLGLLLIHRITGGQWGLALGPALRAAAAALPLAALLAVPLLLGLAEIYPWTHPGASEGGEPGPPDWYLSIPAFTLRTLIYLVLWLGLGWALGAFGTGSGQSRLGQGAAGLGLLALVVSATLAAFDWVMSLDPHWFSAVFGLLVGVAEGTAALALAAAWLAAVGGREADPDRLHDAGNLLLAAALLWAYLWLMQFVTLWVANLPDEIRWLVPRLQTGWRWLGLAVVLLHLLLPAPVLLSRRLKRHPRGLGLAAGLILVAQALFAGWLTLPTMDTQGRALAPTALPAILLGLLGIGGVWLAIFAWRLTALTPDPRRQSGGGR